MTMTELFFGFQGRINRQPYWLATAFVIALALAVAMIIIRMRGSPEDFEAWALILNIPMMWVGLALGAKRLHDRDKSAWWLVIFYVVPWILQLVGELSGAILFQFIAFGFGVWALVELGFLKGTEGPNRFGADPLATSTT